jgi:hypothetical protein
LLFFSNTDGGGKKKRMQREQGEEDSTTVVRAARDLGPEVQEVELGAGDLDRFRCFSFLCSKSYKKIREREGVDDEGQIRKGRRREESRSYSV